MDEHEEFEQIPWSELVARPPDGRRRLVYLVAGGLGALILIILVARAFLSPSPAAPEPAAPAATEGEEAATTGAPGATTPAVESPAPSLLYREEDLMAFPGAPAERVAIARAEWFVRDYFTSDFPPSGSADVLSALPAGSQLPDMPQDLSTGLSYVEWAQAFRIEELSEGRFRVAVLFRCLGAPPEGNFRRLPVRAVELTVEVSASGGSAVADLPSPTALPAGPEPEPWLSESSTAPQAVIDAALATLAGWGVEPRLVSAYADAGGWRVVLTAADEVGNRWPIAVWIDAATVAPAG